MDTARDPEAILRRIQSETRPEGRGQLKLFLGASAGVGKTYAMLSEAHEQTERGVDVVVGFVETHGRRETQALVEGLQVLPLRNVHYRGTVLKEFDLDAALRRHPEMLLVDELPHTNAPESRHAKRWQDIEELLAAGINVTSALNIQHIESLRDVVAQVTGVHVRETVPDAFIDAADEIEVVDIPPDELRQRLQEGKVYIAERAEQALEGFFTKKNLLALREMALRRTADRVESESAPFREEGSVIWSARERVLVCIAPNRLGERVVRSAARLGTAAHAKLFALIVESDRQRHRSPDSHAAAEQALRMAESLGMETARRFAHDIVGEILDYARKRNVTLIVVGKPVKARWREILFGSVVDELVRRSGDMNVHVITGDEPKPATGRPIPVRRRQLEAHSPRDYAVAVLGTAIATGVGIAALSTFPGENVMALYLLTIALVASRSTTRATALCCLLCVAAFDFFFVHPRYTFSVSDVRYLPTFAVMLLVAAIIGRLTLQFRTQAAEASARERQTAALYDLTRELSRSRSKKEIAEAAANRIKDEFGTDAGVLLPGDDGRLRTVVPSRCQFEKDYKEVPVAQWSFEHGAPAGRDTDTLRGSAGLYLPLISGRRTLGVLAVRPFVEGDQLDSAQRTLLETFANAMAVAIERTDLAKETHEARLAAETERVRSALLSSVSHDIRSPLTAIAGAASALLDSQGDSHELAKTIYDASQRLNRDVRNLLDMTRLESGGVKPKLEWNTVEEIVGNALNRTEAQLADREIEAKLEPDLPLIQVDGGLIEQALVNLLENASRHTPAGTSIDVVASRHGDTVHIEVQDRGPGIPDGIRPHLFEKFSQGRRDQEGFGLGLAIASAIMRIHDGSISVEPRPGGGTVFVLTLPVPNAIPEVPTE